MINEYDCYLAYAKIRSRLVVELVLVGALVYASFADMVNTATGHYWFLMAVLGGVVIVTVAQLLHQRQICIKFNESAGPP